MVQRSGRFVAHLCSRVLSLRCLRVVLIWLRLTLAVDEVTRKEGKVAFCFVSLRLRLVSSVVTAVLLYQLVFVWSRLWMRFGLRCDRSVLSWWAGNHVSSALSSVLVAWRWRWHFTHWFAASSLQTSTIFHSSPTAVHRRIGLMLLYVASFLSSPTCSPPPPS